MEALTKMIDQFGFVGIVSFGLTYMVIVAWKYFRQEEIASFFRMIIQGVFVFILLFIPVQFQNMFLEKIKIAIGVVAGSSAFWQIIKAF